MIPELPSGYTPAGVPSCIRMCSMTAVWNEDVFLRAAQQPHQWSLDTCNRICCKTTSPLTSTLDDISHLARLALLISIT